MAEVVELQSIGVSDKRIVEDEAVYEVPDLNKEDENEYMRLDSLVPTANETAEQETINTDGPSKCVSSSTAPTNLSDTERRLLVLCIVLAAVVVISSVSCGILINVMVSIIPGSTIVLFIGV